MFTVLTLKVSDVNFLGFNTIPVFSAQAERKCVHELGVFVISCQEYVMVGGGVGCGVGWGGSGGRYGLWQILFYWLSQHWLHVGKGRGWDGGITSCGGHKPMLIPRLDTTHSMECTETQPETDQDNHTFNIQNFSNILWRLFLRIEKQKE